MSIRLAAYLPLSLCDYPGRPAACMFTQGCNFKCPWCHNSELVTFDGTILNDDYVNIKIQEVIDRVSSGILRGLVITGGEPTTQPVLTDFLMHTKDRAKAAGTTLDIKLDTNGARPDVVKACIDARLVDYIAMDIKAPWYKYSTLIGIDDYDTTGVQETVAIIASTGIPHQFRTTMAPGLTDDDKHTIIEQLPQDCNHIFQNYIETS